MSHLVEFLSRFSSVDGDGPLDAPPAPPAAVKSRAWFWKSG